MTVPSTKSLTSSPFLQTGERPSGAAEGREKAERVGVLREPYEWKSAFGLAAAIFVASLALTPGPTMDHKKFAAEINTKTLKAAAAVTTAPKQWVRVRH